MSKSSRRKFIVGTAVAGTGACICGLSSCATFTKKGSTKSLDKGAYVIENNVMKINISKVPILGKVGGAIKASDTRLPREIIIARTGDAEYSVVSLSCPHRGVEVEYRHDEKQFRCASLGRSTFGVDGVYKKGLAKKSLSRFETAIDSSDKDSLLIRFG